MELDVGSFAAGIEHSFAKVLGSATSPAKVAAGMQEVFDRTEAVLAASLGGEEERIACSAGCGTCCVVNVGVLLPEVIAICHLIKNHWSLHRVEELLLRLEELDRETRWLDDEERIFLRLPCAFLDEESSCSIYPVRPLLCRSITSTDPRRCRVALVAPVFGGESPVLMNLFQKSLMEEVFMAVGRSLERVSLDARGMRLTSTSRRFLEEPQLVRRFLAGDRIDLY